MKWGLLVLFVLLVGFTNAQSSAANVIVEGTIIHNWHNNRPVNGTIYVYKDTTQFPLIYHSDSVGYYSFPIDTAYCYAVVYRCPNVGIEKKFIPKGYNNSKKLTLDVYPQHSCYFTTIQFELDKWDITEDDATIISGIAKSLKDNPQIDTMEFRGHTDSRGSAEDNMPLSTKRLTGVVNLLIKMGIKRNRLTIIPLGEEELLNKCKDGVRCTNEEHAINNRVDFKVVSISSSQSPQADSLKSRVLIRGVISNKNTYEVLSGVRIEVVGQNSADKQVVFSDSMGGYSFYIDTAYMYYANFFKDKFRFDNLFFKKGFSDTTKYFDTHGWTGPSCGGIPVLYFDKKSGKLTEESYDVIKGMEKTMKDNPGIIVEIRAHTDSRGSFESNEKLTFKWADEVVDILISSGIERGRLVPKGMGEYELLNKCKDGVKCSDEEHAINNRVDFKVIRNDYVPQEKK